MSNSSETEPRPLWVEENGAVLLAGIRYNRCGGRFVPPQHYGCEACGADESHLADTLLPSDGTIATYTTVFVHQSLETPYNVAEVKTSEGPVVRGRLECAEPRIGDPVTGSVLLLGDEPRFVFVPAAAEGG